MSIDRRTLLGAAGALGVLATTGTRAQDSSGSAPQRRSSTTPVIDVHTHMFSTGWMERVDAADDPDFQLGPGPARALLYRGLAMGAVVPAMLDFDLRIRAMDEAGVDIALISLTAPNVYWGNRRQSTEAARAINDDFRAAEQRYDGRIRWFASLPWQYADDAIAELRRAKTNGAIGVCMLTNIAGTPLTAPQYRAIWREIAAMDMPVFIHPTLPYVDGFGLQDHGLGNTIGFTTDTSLTFVRMILDGVMDELPNLKLIACHGGGAFPYLIARFDRMWEIQDPASRRNERPPSTYMRQFWYDSIVYDEKTLAFLIESVGIDRVLYGSDYPFRLGDMAGILARVDALPDDRRDAIRGGNARQLFDL
jgi:aminocarboxymuconate-semialdehyde decarboxylase